MNGRRPNALHQEASLVLELSRYWEATWLPPPVRALSSDRPSSPASQLDVEDCKLRTIEQPLPIGSVIVGW